jgi:hypothetical protein
MSNIILNIYLAIHLIVPQLPTYLARSYAAAIAERIENYTPDISYLTYITIISHESKFNTNAISQDGMDWGLMQVRAKYYGAPATNLLNADANIRAGAYILRESERVCRRLLGREPGLEEILSLYTGSLPSCKPNKLTHILLNYQVCLEDEIERGVENNECNF